MLEIDNDDVVFDRDQPDGSAIVMTRDVTGLPLRRTKRVSLVSSVSASKYESVVFDAGHNSEPNSDAANRELDLICCLLLIFIALVCHAVYLHSVKTFVLFVNRSVAKPNQIKLNYIFVHHGMKWSSTFFIAMTATPQCVYRAKAFAQTYHNLSMEILLKYMQYCECVLYQKQRVKETPFSSFIL